MTTYADESVRPGCHACARGWQHCHGIWVEHAAGGDCTEGDCDVPAEAHDAVLACGQVSAGCCESAER